MPSLRVTAGNAAGVEIPVEGELLIGRDAGGAGSLGGDEELSRAHARVSQAGSELVIEDMGSTNGTFVNGVRIEGPTSIGAGDQVRVGATTIEVAADVPAPAAQAPAGPPPGFQPPPGMQGPPPGFPPGGPPAGMPPGGPPAGMPPGGFPGGGPPAGFPGGMPPGFPEGGPAAMVAKMKRRMILIGVGGFAVGFAIATLIWQLL